MSYGNLIRAATVVPLLLFLQSCNDGLTISLQPLTSGLGKKLSLQLEENSSNLNYSYASVSDTSELWLEGPDSQHFVIDTHSGALNPITALDFEVPQDSNLDNYYEMVIARRSSVDGLITYPVKIDVRIVDRPFFESLELDTNVTARSLSLSWTIEDDDPRVAAYSMGLDNTGTSNYAILDLDRNGLIDDNDHLPASASTIRLAPALLQHPLQYRRYQLKALDTAGNVIAVSPIASGHALAQDDLIQYIKSSHVDDRDWFGFNVSLSGDGRVLAVGAPNEDGGGANNNPAHNNAASNAGAVYIYRYDDDGWVFSDYLKSSNPDSNDKFGFNVSLSKDGNTLAVGSPGEAGSGQGANPAVDNLAPTSGATYIYEYESGSWQEPTYIKAHNPDWFNRFGQSVTLNATGDVLAVGANEEDRDGVGINSSSVGTLINSGAVYIFRLTGATWGQEAYIKASNSGETDEFGSTVELNDTGDVLIIAAPFEDSDGAGVNPTKNDLATDSGAAYLYRYDGSDWYEADYLKANNAQAGDQFGYAAALGAIGNTIVITAMTEDGSGAGAQPLSDELATDSGAAYVFEYNGINWLAPSYLKARSPTAGDSFGRSVAISADGLLIAVGARYEQGSGTGLNAIEDENAATAGAAYVFRKASGSWQDPSYVKASNTVAVERFGVSIDISGDGATLAVGANFENGAGAGVNPTTDKSADRAGAVYVY